MSSSNLTQHLEQIQSSTSSLYSQVHSLSSTLEQEPLLDPEHLLIISTIQSDILGIKKLLKPYSSPFTLKRSQSTESRAQKPSYSLLDIIKFFSLGHYLRDPLTQESFIKCSSDQKSLTEFLSLYNSFSLNPDEALFTQFKTLEQFHFF